MYHVPPEGARAGPRGPARASSAQGAAATFTAAAENDLLPDSERRERRTTLRRRRHLLSATLSPSPSPPRPVKCCGRRVPRLHAPLCPPRRPLLRRTRTHPHRSTAPFDNGFIGPISTRSVRRRCSSADSGFFALPHGPFAWFSALVMPLAIVGALIGLAGSLAGCTLPKPRLSASERRGHAVRRAIDGRQFCFHRCLADLPCVAGSGRRRRRSRPMRCRCRARPRPKGAIDPEWVDAGKFALQFKNIRVQIVSATVRPLELASQPRRKVTKEKYLVISRARPPAGRQRRNSRARNGARPRHRQRKGPRRR